MKLEYKVIANQVVEVANFKLIVCVCLKQEVVGALVMNESPIQVVFSCVDDVVMKWNSNDVETRDGNIPTELVKSLELISVRCEANQILQNQKN